MTSELINERGDVDIAAIEALSRQELRQWIFNRLNTHDGASIEAAQNGGMPHYLFALVYPKLNRSVREDFQEVILGFLGDLVSQDNSEWNENSGDELLMLVDPVLVQSSKLEKAVEFLLEIAKSDRFQTAQLQGLHFRALQMLVGLRFRTDREFWHKQYAVGGDRYAAVILEGLGQVDISACFEWLSSIKLSKTLKSALILFLPVLLHEYGVPKFCAAVEKFLPALPKDAKTVFLDFCRAEGLTLNIELAPETRPHSATHPKALRSISGDLDREVVRCRTCGLVQYRARTGNCRRCLRIFPPKVEQSLHRNVSEDLPGDERQLFEAWPNRDAVENIGKRIRWLRENRGMTRTQLQQRSRVSFSYLSKIESGRMTPSLGTLEKIAEALGLGLDHFFLQEQTGEWLVDDFFIQGLRPYLRQLTSDQWRWILDRLQAISGHLVGDVTRKPKTRPKPRTRPRYRALRRESVTRQIASKLAVTLVDIASPEQGREKGSFRMQTTRVQ